MQTNCTLYAKLVKNKRLQTYRLVFSFDAHNRITVQNAVLTTGDVCSTDYVHASVELTKVIQKGMQQLRCSNVQILD
jgi:hypothetical protein